ncbi:MAG: DsrE family protein [Alphaproteobacteria bacterium]|nr:DsrE family protein [Alphaproteobacteria bacterium]
MSKDKTLTFAFMEPPFESARGTTVFRIVSEAVRSGFDVNVFAYEGAVMMSFARQQQHANAVHGRDIVEENHPLPKDWVAALLAEAAAKNIKLDWANCGLCVDERGAGEAIPGVRRGTPADLWKMAAESANTLVVGTH